MTASKQLTGHRQQPVSANFASRLLNGDAGHPTQLDIRKQKDLRVQLWEMLSEINCWRDQNVRSNQCVLRCEGSPYFIHSWIISCTSAKGHILFQILGKHTQSLRSTPWCWQSEGCVETQCIKTWAYDACSSDLRDYQESKTRASSKNKTTRVSPSIEPWPSGD